MVFFFAFGIENITRIVVENPLEFNRIVSDFVTDQLAEPHIERRRIKVRRRKQNVDDDNDGFESLDL
jgi:hypothetical protein